MDTGVLDVNLEDNPYPELCVVRALYIASSRRLRLSRKLVRSLYTALCKFKIEEFVSVQLKHYKRLVVDEAVLLRVINLMRNYLNHGIFEPLDVFGAGVQSQLGLGDLAERTDSSHSIDLPNQYCGTQLSLL